MRLLLVLMLAGCTAIDYSTPPPNEWPALEPVVVVGALNCNQSVGFGMVALACARPDFALKKCFVWLPREAPEWMREHELAHCQGYDHVGDSTLRDYFRQWKGNKNGNP